MRYSRRTVIIRTLLSILFLLIALAPYAAVILGSQDAAFLSVFMTPLFLVSSEIVGIRAVTAWSQMTSDRKRHILIWSLLYVASAVSALIMVRGAYLVAATPYCADATNGNGCDISFGFPAYFCIGAFTLASVLGLLIAPILALVDTAKTHAWLWFMGILIYLLGSWASAGLILAPLGASALTTLTAREWLTLARAALPLLAPFIALLYSLTGRERRKGNASVDD